MRDPPYLLRIINWYFYIGSSLMKEKNIKVLTAIFIVVVAVLSYFAIKGVSLITFDYEFEKFFPKNDRETQYFETHRANFGSDNDFLLIGIKNNVGIFDSIFLDKIDALTKLLEKGPYINQVLSPTNFKQPIIDPLFGTIFKKSVLRFNQPQYYAIDSAYIFNDELLIGNHFSVDAKAITLIVSTEEYISKVKCDSIARYIESALATFNFDTYHVAGRSVGQIKYIELIEKELTKFVLASIVLVIIFLVIAFRSIWGVIVPFIIVMLSIIWLIGFLGLWGKPLGILSTILPTILFIVGMSDVVHFLSKYLEGIRLGHSKKKVTIVAFKEIGVATMLTTLTTAIGFITLLTSNTEPVREFGLQASLGVAIAYILTFTLLPLFLLWRKKPFSKPLETTKKEVFWEKHLQKLFLFCTRNPKRLVTSFSLLIIVCFVGISLISQNNYLLDDIRETNPIKKDFNFFDENFSGVRPFELSISFDKASSITFEQLRVLDTLEVYLKNTYGLNNTYSLLSVAKLINKGLNGGNNKYFKLPESESNQKKIITFLSRLVKTGELKQFVSSDYHKLRISGKIEDLGSQIFRIKNKAFYDFAQTTLPSNVKVHITGTAHLLDINNQTLSNTLLKGLALAFLVIAGLMGLLFKSFKMVVVSLIPNTIPLLLIAAIMGFFGIELKITTSIIFTIIFGIAVDDTIHFMSKLKLEMEKGKSILYALKRTYLSTGKAIIITTLILSGGFLTLVLSDFMGTYYLGLLVSLALIFAVLSDLMLLPALLLMLHKKKEK